jgi:cysteinyl-tRNA synthetase
VLTLFQPTTNVLQKKDSEAIDALQKLVQSFGKSIETPTIDALMQTLLIAREDARKNKDYNTADHIRKDLEQLGFEIQDTIHGPVWRKK